MIRPFFRRPSRPFTTEIELSLGLAYLVIALLVFFLEQRLINIGQAADARIQASEMRLARVIGQQVADALGAHLLPVPSDDSGVSEILDRTAQQAGLLSVEVHSLSEPGRRIASGSVRLGPSMTPPAAELDRTDRVYGPDARSEATVLWYSLRTHGYSGLALRLEWEANPFSRMRSETRLAAILVPVVLLVIGVVLFLQVGRINRRMMALVRGAVETGMSGDLESARDETTFVEGAIRRTSSELRKREAELEVLLVRERERAGELHTVSAALRRHMPGGLVAVDGDGIVRDVNSKARWLFSIDAKKIGSPCGTVFESTPELIAPIQRALSGRETVVREEIEVSVHSREGETATERRVLTVSAVPVMGGEGRFLGVLLFALDVTAVRELERRLRLREALAFLGEMSAGLAHELRNAVAAAAGFCRLSVEDIRSSESARALAHLDRVREELRLLEGTVNQFLDFASTRAVETGPIDLAPVVEELVADFRTRYPDISFHIECADVSVQGERVRIRQILWNLVTNSAQELVAFERKPAEVRLSVRSSRSGRIEIEIEDNGRGVPPEIATTMFLPFVSGREGGSGLGLSLVQRNALALGGEVRYLPRPDGTGAGARFVVDLPAGDDQPDC